MPKLTKAQKAAAAAAEAEAAAAAAKPKKTQRVKMITRYSGPAGNCEPNGEIEVAPKDAEQLVAGGYATYVGAEPAKQEEDPPAE